MWSAFHVNLTLMSQFMFEPIPWSAFDKDDTHFWIHYSLVILGFLVSIATLIGQWRTPAPYGKHNTRVKGFALF